MSESSPIFFPAAGCTPSAAAQEYPGDFRSHRALRAYNPDKDMIDAVVLENEEPERVSAPLPGNRETAFLPARSLPRGCYTVRIERV